MRYFEHLHPLCILIYFIVAIGMTLACFDPAIAAISVAAALCFNFAISGWKGIKGYIMFLLPLCLLIAIINPLVSHRGVTMLFTMFGQWITLEALCYGGTAALSLAAMILWFGCYSKVMTADKFMYLVGRPAPATALLITMTFQGIAKLTKQLAQIRDCQKFFEGSGKNKVAIKTKAAIRHTSTLAGWSLESAVEQADSMKARGYGIRRRTSFHLFHFETRDAIFLAVIVVMAAALVTTRALGFGTMEFYPRIRHIQEGSGNYLIMIIFAVMAFLPTLLEWKEYLKWRSYGLIQ